MKFVTFHYYFALGYGVVWATPRNNPENYLKFISQKSHKKKMRKELEIVKDLGIRFTFANIQKMI